MRNLIFNETELEENYKWMHPCYTINNKNVVLIHGFKDYVALLFQKGAILEDKYHTLIQQTERVQAARQLRFNSLEEIEKRKDEIKYYLNEAIKTEKAGKNVPMKRMKIMKYLRSYNKNLKSSPFKRSILPINARTSASIFILFLTG